MEERKERRVKSIREKVEEIKKNKDRKYEPPMISVYKGGGSELMSLTP